MSGILRNTLRFVGKAKYATNNSTKYLRSMTLSTNHLNNSLSLIEANEISTVRAAQRKILSIFGQEIKTSNISDFEVSLTSGRVAIITPSFFFGKKDCIFPSKFTTKLNEKSIKPESNITADEEEIAFKIGNWNASLAGDSLVLRIKNSNKTIILKHAVHVQAHISPRKILKNGSVLHTLRRLGSDIAIFPLKITSKTTQSGLSERLFSPVQAPLYMASKKFLEFGNNLPDILTKDGDNEITDAPNSFGKMKLQFPMTASLENQQKIKIKNSNDTFTVYHTVKIQAYENDGIPENLKFFFSDAKINEIPIDEAGILRMELESGNLSIQPMYFSGRRIDMRQDVVIEIDLDSAVPTLYVCPHLKRILNEE